jgi:hypothetical protein
MLREMSMDVRLMLSPPLNFLRVSLTRLELILLK